MANLLLIHPNFPAQAAKLAHWLSPYTPELAILATSPARIFHPPKLLPATNIPPLTHSHILLIYYKHKHTFPQNSPLHPLLSTLANTPNHQPHIALIELTKSKEITESIPSQALSPFASAPDFFSIPLRECYEGSLSKVTLMQFVEEFLARP